MITSMLDVAYKQKVTIDPIAILVQVAPRKVRKLLPTRHVGWGKEAICLSDADGTIRTDVRQSKERSRRERERSRGVYGSEYGMYNTMP
jgi:hypothetical protein